MILNIWLVKKCLKTCKILAGTSHATWIAAMTATKRILDRMLTPQEEVPDCTIEMLLNGLLNQMNFIIIWFMSVLLF